MSRWYRAYAGTVRDDKLAEAAVIAGCSRSVAIAAWHSILESAAEIAEGGRFDTTPRRVAAILGEKASIIEGLFGALTELGMIQDQAVAAWSKRQFESDSSTERSRKHRETRRNGDATLQQQPATPPDTDTELYADAEKMDKKSISQNSSSPPVERKAAKPFPGDGPISYGHWADLVKANKPGIDCDVIASQFRTFCRTHDPPIPLDHALIERRFVGWLKTHRPRLHA